MIKQLQELLERRVDQCVNDKSSPCIKIEKKKELLAKRDAEIVKANAKGKIVEKSSKVDLSNIHYIVHFQYLIKQKDQFIFEEELEHRIASFYKGSLMSDQELNVIGQTNKMDINNLAIFNEMVSNYDKTEERLAFHYDRRKAVQYAERYWNEYNPQYQKFTDDCTNFISQCLRAGGAPMRGYPNRSRGWWYQGGTWSYSWTVAHALKLYLSTSKDGLRAKEVKDPRDLLLGDVICYDFQGNGRFDHNTIVTAKDALGYPLVNAHTTNSRMRYWSYEDSTAYTDQIQYKFYTIVDDN